MKVEDEAGARRRFLRTAAGSMTPLLGVSAFAQAAGGPTPDDRVDFPQISAPAEAPERMPDPGDPPEARVGFALVGLGRLTVGRLLPAFAKTRHCRPVALVSGDPDKAGRLAHAYGIAADSIYDYRSFDRITDDPRVQVVYVVLPNSMHAEYTIRAARAGKHVLCEKPMAPSSADCVKMIEACAAAGSKLMIAYRSQYEPKNRALVEMVRAGRLGTLKELIATNSQNQGDPAQWRLKKALSGGGAMPDVGIYCLNAARFVSDEEPAEVLAWTHSTPNDPRFREVEETVHFLLRFPSGFQATCHSSYGAHKSQFMRLLGSEGWAELDPGFAYDGIRLRISRLEGDRETSVEPAIREQDQFALEMDHMADCVRSGREPRSGGADGLQDIRIVEAIYESAKANGKPIRLSPPAGPVRGPELPRRS